MLNRFTYTNEQTFFQKLKSIDWILVFCILLIGLISFFAMYSTDGGEIKFYTKMTGKTSKHNKYRNLEWDKPSPTIVAHLYKDGLMFIHPDAKQSRSITIREAASLQSFDDDYEFSGKMGVDYKMIGNAVPPLMAKKIAEVLKSFF